MQPGHQALGFLFGHCTIIHIVGDHGQPDDQPLAVIWSDNRTVGEGKRVRALLPSGHHEPGSWEANADSQRHTAGVAREAFDMLRL
jgi:hypothetical protein